MSNPGDSVTAPDQQPTLDANELDRVLAKVIRDYEDSIAASDSPALAKFRVERRFLVGRLKELRSSLASLLADSQRINDLERYWVTLDTADALRDMEMEGATLEGQLYLCWTLPGDLRSAIDSHVSYRKAQLENPSVARSPVSGTTDT